MRMREGHMLNGQLKLVYNVKIAVENYFVIHSYVSNEQTEYIQLGAVQHMLKTYFFDTIIL